MQVGGFTIPVSFDALTVLSALIALVALATVASGVIHVVRERRVRVMRFGSGLVLLLLGLLVLAVAGWAQTYRALTHNQLVATIRAVSVPDKSQTMLVTYTPMNDGTPGKPQLFTVKGDEWQLGGEIIKWQDYVNILGVNTGYRTTRLMGYYDNSADYQHKPITAYDLDGGSNTVQQFLQNHPNLMPFVRAVYGNDVRMIPDQHATYKVYVSTSGYWTAL